MAKKDIANVAIQTVIITADIGIIMNPATKALNIKKSVIEDIFNSFDLKQEDGGILGVKDDVIVSFCFDKGNNEQEYIINVSKFSKTLEEWDDQDIAFAGFIHSHPGKSKGEPSMQDFMYLKRFMKANELDELLFPIIYSKNGEKVIQFYLFKNNDFIKIDYLVI